MTTAERAAGIVDAFQACAYEDSFTSEELQALVATELGHTQILDSPQSHGDVKSQAFAPETILHIIAGNTPMSGIQSIIRGLLLGSHNLLKLPSADMPELVRFLKALPQDLQELVTTSRELPHEWLSDSKAIIVFGNDETISHFRNHVRADQIFISHGHRISFGIVFDDKDHSAAGLAARDVSLFDQQGCLSPHDLYIDPDSKVSPLDFAEELAREMDLYNQSHPRGPISSEENASIAALRESYDFRQSNDPKVRLWTSDGSTDWTVIYEEEPKFTVSPLNRVVYVKPLPELSQLAGNLSLILPYLSSVAIHPFDQKHCDKIQHLKANRICPLGKSQQPSLFWHQDGLPQLSSLVNWMDIG